MQDNLSFSYSLFTSNPNSNPKQNMGGILLKDSFIFWVTFPIPGFLSGAPCKDIFLENTSVKEKGNCAPVFVCRKNQSQNIVFL